MNNRLLIKVFIAMALAVIAGTITGTEMGIFGVPFVRIYTLIGKLFLNALTLVVVPLVAASIITGTARIGAEKSFRALGAKTFGWYVTTTTIAVCVGWMTIMAISPGKFLEGSELVDSMLKGKAQIEQVITTQQGDGFSNIENIFFKLIPSNILAVASQGQMLGLILFCLLFGFFIPRIESGPGTTLLHFWQGIFQVILNMTHLVMYLLPIGVFGLVARVVAETGFSAIKPISLFFLTTLIAFAIYALICVPILLRVFGGVNPVRFFRAMTPAIFTGFSTSSSAATLPITIDCAEKRAGISNRITSFTIPLATTLNLSGTALYNCIAVFFICQVYGVELTLSLQLFIVTISIISSFGIGGIPSASIAAIILILHTIGLPADGIALIYAVERILDMFRTSVNVIGNSCCAVLVARSAGETNVLAA